MAVNHKKALSIVLAQLGVMARLVEKDPSLLSNYRGTAHDLLDRVMDDVVRGSVETQTTPKPHSYSHLVSWPSETIPTNKYPSIDAVVKPADYFPVPDEHVRNVVHTKGKLEGVRAYRDLFIDRNACGLMTAKQIIELYCTEELNQYNRLKQ